MFLCFLWKNLDWIWSTFLSFSLFFFFSLSLFLNFSLALCYFIRCTISIYTLWYFATCTHTFKLTLAHFRDAQTNTNTVSLSTSNTFSVRAIPMKLYHSWSVLCEAQLWESYNFEACQEPLGGHPSVPEISLLGSTLVAPGTRAAADEVFIFRVRVDNFKAKKIVGGGENLKRGVRELCRGLNNR